MDVIILVTVMYKAHESMTMYKVGIKCFVYLLPALSTLDFKFWTWVTLDSATKSVTNRNSISNSKF